MSWRPACGPSSTTPASSGSSPPGARSAIWCGNPRRERRFASGSSTSPGRISWRTSRPPQIRPRPCFSGASTRRRRAHRAASPMACCWSTSRSRAARTTCACSSTSRAWPRAPSFPASPRLRPPSGGAGRSTGRALQRWSNACAGFLARAGSGCAARGSCSACPTVPRPSRSTASSSTSPRRATRSRATSGEARSSRWGGPRPRPSPRSGRSRPRRGSHGSRIYPFTCTAPRASLAPRVPATDSSPMPRSSASGAWV